MLQKTSHVLDTINKKSSLIADIEEAHQIIVIIECIQNKEKINIKFKKDDTFKLILHWGIYKDFPIKKWYHSNKLNFPLKTIKFDDYALDTEFIKDENREEIEFNFYKPEGIGLSFCFYEPFKYYKNWYNNNRKDFQIKFNKEEKIQTESKMKIILYKIRGKEMSKIIYDMDGLHNSNVLNEKNETKNKLDEKNDTENKLNEKNVTKNKINENNVTKKKLNKMKKELLERQKKNRNMEKQNKNTLNSTNKNEDDKKEKVRQVLEDICIYGNIMKEQIKEEKEANPENFIEINDALNLENDDQQLFALGLIGNILQKNGTEVAIEKKNIEENEEEENANLTSLEFISNGMIQKKKYDLHFDFGESKNEEYLNDDNKFEDLKEQIKTKISKDYNISKDEIIVTFPHRGSYCVQVIFESDKFNNINIKDFQSKFRNDKDFPELNNLKEIHSDVLMSLGKLSKNQLDYRGNRCDGWGINEQRGNMDYYPPIGWIGIGLNVMNKYDNGDNTWLEMYNLEGEWCVAYHGIGRCKEGKEVKKITSLIIEEGLKEGKAQAHFNCEDKFHPGKKVGEGVYCSPKIKEAEKYAGTIEINGKKYKTAFMVRVKPDAIRCCGNDEYAKDYWVINGTSDEIRPYRILYKEVKEE